MARIASLLVLLVIIGLLGFVFVRVMAGFWLPLFLAALLVVIFRPLHQWILDACEGKQKRAAILTTLAILLVVLGPLGWISTIAVAEAKGLFSRSWADDVKHIETRTSGLRTRFKLDMPFAEPLKNLEDLFQQLMSQHQGEGGPAILEIDPQVCVQLIDQTNDAIVEIQRQLTQRQSNAADPNGDLVVSAEDFESLKLQIRQAHEPILDKANAEITVNDARECSQLLNQAFLTFCGMKEELLGGPFHAWLIELANPSKSQLHEWQGKALGYLRQTVVSLTGQTTAFALSLLFGMFVLVIALYYFLVDGPKMIRAAMRLSPLDDKYEAELFAEFANVSRAVVLATLLSAGGQAILAGIGYAVVGAGPLFLLTVVTGLMAMVPFVGASRGLVAGRSVGSVCRPGTGRRGSRSIDSRNRPGNLWRRRCLDGR